MFPSADVYNGIYVSVCVCACVEDVRKVFCLDVAVVPFIHKTALRWFVCFVSSRRHFYRHRRRRGIVIDALHIFV